MRHRSLLGALLFRNCYIADRSWEPWCSEMFTLPLALGSLGVESLLHCHSLLGASVLIIVYVTVRSWEGVESLLRHRPLLGALVFRDCYIAARSWEPWCSEMFTLPLALGTVSYTHLTLPTIRSV